MTDTSGCLRKIGYITRAEANDAKKRVMASPTYRSDAGMSVYCCDRCGSFHLGRDRKRGNAVNTYNAPGRRVNMEKMRRYYQLANRSENE